MSQIPLNYEASAGDSHKQTVTSLPPEVVQCLENARFVSYPPWPLLMMILRPLDSHVTDSFRPK